MKQLKYLLYYFCMIPITSVVSMGQRDIEAAFREAFKNFNITEPIPTNVTPEQSTVLWSTTEGKCTLSSDATTNKDLCAFATHWLAASIKNETIARVKNTLNATTAGIFALMLPGLFLAEDSKLRVYAALATLGLTAVNAPKRLADWVKTKCDEESFGLAGAKLFEKERYTALFAYFTHLQIHQHLPLPYSTKDQIIRTIAAENKAQFGCKIGAKDIVTILEKQGQDFIHNKTTSIKEEFYNRMPCLEDVR